MTCKNCGKEIAPVNKIKLCKVCRFKKLYPSVDYERYNQLMKQTKAILKHHDISHEGFANLSGYEIGTVKQHFNMRCYSKEFEETMKEVLKRLGH